MSNSNTKACREVRINVEYGLHMRPADVFSKTATRFLSEIQVMLVDRGERVNGKSLLDLMTLAAECGAILQIQAEGPDAEIAVDALCRLVESNFDDNPAGASSRAV